MAVDDEVTKLKKDMDQLRTDIGGLTEALKSMGAEKGREAVARAKQSGASMREEAEALRARANSEIEERPLTSVLMSFGIGFLIGMLLDRRR